MVTPCNSRDKGAPAGAAWRFVGTGAFKENTRQRDTRVKMGAFTASRWQAIKCFSVCHQERCWGPPGRLSSLVQNYGCRLARGSRDHGAIKQVGREEPLSPRTSPGMSAAHHSLSQRQPKTDLSTRSRALWGGDRHIPSKREAGAREIFLKKHKWNTFLFMFLKKPITGHS